MCSAKCFKTGKDEQNSWKCTCIPDFNEKMNFIKLNIFYRFFWSLLTNSWESILKFDSLFDWQKRFLCKKHFKFIRRWSCQKVLNLLYYAIRFAAKSFDAFVVDNYPWCPQSFSNDSSISLSRKTVKGLAKYYLIERYERRTKSQTDWKAY